MLQELILTTPIPTSFTVEPTANPVFKKRLSAGFLWLGTAFLLSIGWALAAVLKIEPLGPVLTGLLFFVALIVAMAVSVRKLIQAFRHKNRERDEKRRKLAQRALAREVIPFLHEQLEIANSGQSAGFPMPPIEPLLYSLTADGAPRQNHITSATGSSGTTTLAIEDQGRKVRFAAFA